MDQKGEDFKMSGEVVGEFDRFKYFGSVQQKCGGFEKSMMYKIKREWLKRREA